MTDLKVHRSSFANFISAIALFSLSLENFGTIRYPISITFALLSFIIIASKVKAIDRKSTFVYMFFLVITVALTIVSSSNSFTYVSNIGYSGINFFFSMLLKLSVSFLIVISLKNDKDALFKVITAVLLLHISFFWIQFITVYSTGVYLDPMNAIVGSRQRYGGSFSLPIIGQIYRPTGFYEEPSTYSAFIVCMLAARFYVNKTVDKITWFSVFSIIFSFSVASIMYGFLILGYLIFYHSKFNLKIIIAFIFPILVWLLFIVVEGRLNAVDNASSIREGLMDVVFNQPKSIVLFGNGMLGVPEPLAPYIREGNLWRAGVASLNDNGLWLFMIMKVGVLGLLSFLSLAIFKLKNKLNIFMFLVLIVTKLSFLYFYYVFYILVIFSADEDSQND
ncbi:hypothetical protein AB4186_24775 [Vibrio lentus]